MLACRPVALQLQGENRHEPPPPHPQHFSLGNGRQVVSCPQNCVNGLRASGGSALRSGAINPGTRVIPYPRKPPACRLWPRPQGAAQGSGSKEMATCDPGLYPPHPDAQVSEVGQSPLRLVRRAGAAVFALSFGRWRRRCVRPLASRKADDPEEKPPAA